MLKSITIGAERNELVENVFEAVIVCGRSTLFGNSECRGAGSGVGDGIRRDGGMGRRKRRDCGRLSLDWLLAEELFCKEGGMNRVGLDLHEEIRSSTHRKGCLGDATLYFIDKCFMENIVMIAALAL